jgi:hypothetical protein
VTLIYLFNVHLELLYTTMRFLPRAWYNI